MPSARNFFTQKQQEDIRQAIMNAELDTSGEIRVHIENTCKDDVLDRALAVFNQLGMEKTASRNGVLIYLAVKNRKFAVIGDEAIHTVVTEGFWDGLRNRMLDHFREDRFTEGLIEAITETGKQLKTYFPHQSDDVNELSDEISFN
ncbi:MAG: TPM domain-containing protein [Bacteroidota bacterium]